MLELELRYHHVKDGVEHACGPKIVIGIYDTWEEAEKIGNEIINDTIQKYYPRKLDNFKKNHIYGMPKDLVCYYWDKNVPDFFFKITKLNISNDVDTFIGNAIKDYNEYKKWFETQE